MSPSESRSLASSQVAISGASGLVGSALTRALAADGATVLPISRSNRGNASETIVWDPTTGLINPDRLSSVDTVVHLAGESIASGRWNENQKAKIRDSRVQGTASLVKSMAAISERPKTLICASAIGFYGNRGDEELTETSDPGTGFLPDVSLEWEAAADAATELGMRVVKVRIGVVLSPLGGALQKMMLPFKMGMGGVVGSGKQYWSWIGLNDLVRVFQFCISTPDLSGTVNAVSPHPVTNREFTKTLGSVLKRPTIIPLPAFVARLALGEMANDLLLASARVLPERLQQLNFAFQQPNLEESIRFELQQASQTSTS
ncbi:MAG: TIGR01777 family oxidoreductase [Fuerstiella sp.]